MLTSFNMARYESLYLLIIFLSLVNTTKIQVEELIPSVRNKLQHLTDTKQITRDAEPYVEKELKDKEEYDFIIVGAGSSGSILVNRLSEITQWKILLLEAGGEPDILTEVPMWSALLQFTDQNWGHKTEKEKNFGLGLEDQRMKWPRGKGLGGTSNINYLVYSRGNPLDYDQWSKQGNPGWSFEDILPIFKTLEDCKFDYENEKNYRFKGGDISIEQSKYKTKSAEVFVKAAENAGYKYVDYNGIEQEGVSYAQTTTKNGLRWSGEKAFIRPAKNRENLTIRTNSHVTKLLLSKNKVYGVEFVKNNKTFTAKAKKEVILSAGALNSPHILLLSGIGPKKELEKHGIRVVANLPVGKQVYDHPAFWGLAISVNESIIFDSKQVFEEEQIKALYNKGESPLSSIGAESLLFMSTFLNKYKRPDIEVVFVSQHVSSDEGVVAKNVAKISDETYEDVFKPLVGKNVFVPIIILLHPKSSGRMELNSKNGFVFPKIYSGFLSDPENFDVKTMIAAIRETIRIVKTKPFDRYGVEVVQTTPRACKKEKYDSDEYWECCLRHLTVTTFHPSTTCRMGPADDPYAVVDNRLRVYGIDNLRVADASVIPVSMTGHTHIPACVVGEKAARIIKEEYL